MIGLSPETGDGGAAVEIVAGKMQYWEIAVQYWEIVVGKIGVLGGFANSLT